MSSLNDDSLVAQILFLQKVWAITTGTPLPIGPHRFPPYVPVQRALDRIQMQVIQEGVQPSDAAAFVAEKLSAFVGAVLEGADGELPEDHPGRVFGPDGPSSLDLIGAAKELDLIARGLPADAPLRQSMFAARDQLTAAGGARLMSEL